MTRRDEELGSLWGVGSARPRGDTDGKEGKITEVENVKEGL